MKASRQAKLIEIIEQESVKTQDELAERLLAAGYASTQATISRDLRELKITKMAVPGGEPKYVQLTNRDNVNMVRYTRVLKDGILTMEAADNIIVIKTVAGLAMAVAAALDNLNLYGVVGSIAGDDTIMCVIRSKDMADEVIDSISKYAADSASNKREEDKDVTKSSC
ncbi:MAG: arginine repressor [Lachnospiraceae bacterium]|nr:arginine repressor [Lachnospiraceae bacterium]